MSGAQDLQGRGTYFKSELLCASSFISDIILRWEKSCRGLNGADAELVKVIRSKQREWEDAALKCECPPTSVNTPANGTPPTRTDVLVGPRYAAHEALTGGGLSFEGPMYAPLIRQIGPKLSKTNAADEAGSIRISPSDDRVRASSFDPVRGQGDARSESGPQENGGVKISREGVSSQQRMERSLAVAPFGEAANHAWRRQQQYSSEHPAEKEGNGSAERDVEQAGGFDHQRLPSAPSYSSLVHARSEAKTEGDGESLNGAETGGQKERRRKRLERKRKKESVGNDGNGLPGAKAAFGAQHGGQEWASPELEGATGGAHQNGDGMLQETPVGGEVVSEPGMDQDGGVDLGPLTGHDRPWSAGVESGDEASKGCSAEDAEYAENGNGDSLQGAIDLPRPTTADFPALSGGVRPPAAGGPLKRFTILKRPGSLGAGDDVTGAKSSWAKHISSRAAETEGGVRESEVRTDSEYQEFVRKRAAFEEEDRRKRRKMRTKDDFECYERLKGGKMVNSVQGLVLHEQFLDDEEQAAAVRMIRELEQLGAAGALRGRTYTAPRKWMKGKGRVTIQFGCCYNYAVDKQGRPPGILQDEAVEPLPTFLEDILDRMVRWKVMPGGTKRPNSAIINLYSEGDCIPIHIDHHDFDRPFCTMSLLSVAPIKFGATMESLDAGQFSGAFELPLPKGSVCILNGNAADVAKHCIPSVPEARISVTFRRMKPDKAPFTYIELPLPDLPVFHERAFAPSLVSPSLKPSDSAPSSKPPRFEAAPIDVSAELWPDLSGKPAGGPVEGEVGRASGAVSWARRPPTRPLSGGGPVPADGGRVSRSANASPAPTRPSSGGGPVSGGNGQAGEWPELGTTLGRGPLKRSTSLGRESRPNESGGTVGNELLPSNARASSQMEAQEPLPPRPSSQSEAALMASERDPLELPKEAAQVEMIYDEQAIGRNGDGFGRSKVRFPSPNRPLGVRTSSQPGSPDTHPSKQFVASDTETLNPVKLGGDEPDFDNVEPPAFEAEVLSDPRDLGPDERCGSGANPELSANPESNPNAGKETDPSLPMDHSAVDEAERRAPESDGHGRTENGTDAKDGFAEGQVSPPDWRSEMGDANVVKGGERSIPRPPQNGRTGNGHEGRRSREPSPVTTNPAKDQGLEWRRERRSTQPQAQFSYPEAGAYQQYDERGTIAYGGRGRSDERSTGGYRGRGPNGWRTEFRGRSEERRFNQESREGQNGWGRGNGSEAQNGAQSRYSSQGRNEWGSGPDSTPPHISGRLVSAADEYRRGAYGEQALPVESSASEGYLFSGTDSKKALAAAAPAFVPRAVQRSASGSGLQAHRPRQEAGQKEPVHGAYPHHPRQDAMLNGSGHGEYSHQPEQGSRLYPAFWTLEPEGRSNEQGRAGIDGQDRRSERVPVVDARCVFDSYSRPSSASSSGEQSGDGPMGRPSGIASPETFAMFFPKETPKKVRPV